MPEDGHNAWHSVRAWGGVALIAAALTFAPALGSALRLTSYGGGLAPSGRSA